MRRIKSAVIVAISASALALTTSSAADAATPASNWTQDGYNGAQTAYNPDESTLTTSKVGGLKAAWHRSELSSATAVGGYLWAATDGGIDRVSLRTGGLKRHYPLGSRFGVPSAPVVSASRFIAGAQGVLESVSIASGKVAWRINAHDTGNVGHTWNYPLLTGSQLFTVFTTYTSSTSRYTYTLEAINASTGKIEWRKPVSYGPIAAGGGQVYATELGQNLGPGAYDQVVVALSAKTGKQAWAYQFPELQSVTNYAVAAGRLLATAGGSIYGSDIYSLSSASGAVQWAHKDSASAGQMQIAPAGSNLMITSSQAFYLSSNNHLVALNLATGKTQWRRGYLGHNGRSLIGAAGVAYSDNPKGQVTAYRMSTGIPLWYSKAGNYQPELVASGRLVAISYGGDTDENTTMAYAR